MLIFWSLYWKLCNSLNNLCPRLPAPPHFIVFNITRKKHLTSTPLTGKFILGFHVLFGVGVNLWVRTKEISNTKIASQKLVSVEVLIPVLPVLTWTPQSSPWDPPVWALCLLLPVIQNQERQSHHQIIHYAYLWNHQTVVSVWQKRKNKRRKLTITLLYRPSISVLLHLV